MLKFRNGGTVTELSKITRTLTEHKTEFVRRFRVKSLAVFGSYARGDQRADSDLDLLVEFSAPVGIEFLDLATYLEQLLGLRVDLVSKKGVKPRYLARIEPDLKYV